jgi:beta-glucuronidase
MGPRRSVRRMFHDDHKDRASSRDTITRRAFVAGMHVWAFADFKTGQSSSRVAATNFKGVFTRDRQPKMAAHFLRSRWFGK